MTRELRRLLGTPLYWLLFLGAVAFGGGLAWLQRRYRPGAYWIFIDQFWDSATRSLAVKSQRTNNKYRCLDNW